MVAHGSCMDTATPLGTLTSLIGVQLIGARMADLGLRDRALWVFANDVNIDVVAACSAELDAVRTASRYPLFVADVTENGLAATVTFSGGGPGLDPVAVTAVVTA